jgi:hypothetical protein
MKVFSLGFSLLFLCQAHLFGFDQELRDRVLDGDRVALDHIRELPENERAEILYSCLYSYVRRKLQKAHPEIASDLAQEFVEMDGHAEFLRNELAVHTSGSGRKREAFFKVTSLLRSKEVEEMLAELTFDDRVFDSPGSLQIGIYSPMNSNLAARSLGEMGLADSPLPDKNTLSYDRSDVELWQKWAVNRVPAQNPVVNEPDPAPSEDKVKAQQQVEFDTGAESEKAESPSLPKWVLVLFVVVALVFLVLLLRLFLRSRAS